jgi:maltooligosyltrehalose synthase
MRLLGLRGRRPEVFTHGTYEAVDAGPDCCAFTRGGELLVAVNLREELEGSLELPRGRWRDLFTGEERTFDRQCPLARVLGEDGFAVFERL